MSSTGSCFNDISSKDSEEESDVNFKQYNLKGFNDGIKVLYSNLDSMPNKRDEIIARINVINPHILCFTETIPKNIKYYNEADYIIPNYERFYNKEHKHGVAIYFHSSMKAQECNDFNEFLFQESLWCSFRSKEGCKVLIGGIYRPPRTYHEGKENEDILFNMLKSEKMLAFDKILIMGDFNFPNLDFEGTYTGDIDANRLESFRDTFLIQKVINPTRRRVNQRPTRDDLIFVNEDQLISDITHENPFGKSDHECLIFDLYVSLDNVSESCGYTYNLKKGDYCKMRADARDLDWSPAENVENQWSLIKKNIVTLMENCIPKKKKGRKNKKLPSWMCKKTLRKIKKKHKLYNRFLQTKNGSRYLKYITARNECNKQIRKAKKRYEKNVAKDSKSNPKQFWKFVQEKMKVKQGISVLKNEDGSLSESDFDKAETLNNFFASVFTREDKSNVPSFNEGEKSEGALLSDIRVTPEAVKLKLKNLNPSKAQGPDCIPPKVLKELCNELSNPLCHLFNLSIDTGLVPNEWKEGTITAIYKKGARSDPGNYRPVSLTSVICKVMESLVRDEVVKHFDDYSLYSKNQYGFRRKRSCASQLLCVMEDFAEWMDSGDPFDVVYLDFSKAFDSVPHERLLQKLFAYGITGKVLAWIRSFLSGRTQRVKVGEAISGHKQVLSGIPQGSILGPILFTIFINDLPDGLKSCNKIFADDTKIYNKSVNNDIIQSDLYLLQEWTSVWDLHFNIKKCKVLYAGPKNPKHQYNMKLKNGVQVVTECAEEKDLGVWFDSSMSFDNHINKVVSKANQITGIIRRSFSFLDKSTFLQLYKSMIRPHVEYANSVWSPYLKRQSVAIEKVQRRATKLIPECKQMSYSERLQFLKLYSLKGRRLRGDLIEVYKMFNGFTDIDLKDLFELNVCSTRRSEGKITVKHSKTKRRRYSFSFRVASQWNLLPYEVKFAKNTNAFKNFLDANPKIVELFYDYDG